MKKVIVTGGSGFIGSNLVNYLIKKRYFVINIDKLTYSSNKLKNRIRNNKNYKLIKLDINNKKKSPNITALIVPGSQNVLNQIIDEGLDAVFEKSGFEIRQPGCSACLGMNEDKVPPGKLCISTSNRNFEGRQGPGSRTILSSPLMAAAAAIHGKIVDINE